MSKLRSAFRAFQQMAAAIEGSPAERLEARVARLERQLFSLEESLRRQDEASDRIGT